MLGQLMELHGENSFKAKSYEGAAFRLKRLERPLAEMSEQERAALPGVGQAIQAKIAELLEHGHLAALDELLEKTPAGVVDLLRIKGLGAKKVGTIWRDLEVESLGELLYACRENRLALLKGFGEKTQAQVMENIEFLQSQSGLFHYAQLEPLAKNLGLALEAVCGRVEQCGALRRRAIVLDTIEFVVEHPKPLALAELLGQSKGVTEVQVQRAETESKGGSEACDCITGRLAEGIPFTLYVPDPKAFERCWFERSASVEHRKALPPNIDLKAGDEQAIYASAGLSWIDPELREGRSEIELAAKNKLPTLILLSDIRGAVHNHSTWSDGTASIEAMARACMAIGLEYLVISDHSRTAVYAGGLSIERVEAQAREIDALNEHLAPFRIFKSIESDILADGSLDYPDEVLARFDLVIASVHSGLKMDKSRATQRLLKAIQNPYTSILGHPSGRLLLSRPGYELDYPLIIQACAENGVVIELNANPWRLDMDWTWIEHARNAGVLISINPDAHSTDGLHDIHYGVLAARKGGAESKDVLNTSNLEEFSAWITQQRMSRLELANNTSSQSL